jgi:hypothetical protein
MSLVHNDVKRESDRGIKADAALLKHSNAVTNTVTFVIVVYPFFTGFGIALLLWSIVWYENRMHDTGVKRGGTKVSKIAIKSKMTSVFPLNSIDKIKQNLYARTPRGTQVSAGRRVESWKIESVAVIALFDVPFIPSTCLAIVTCHG